MDIYIDNKIIKNILYLLVNQGVDIDKILEQCNISKSDLITDHGRIHQKKLIKLHQIMLPFIFRHPTFFSMLSIKELYQDYPELLSLCLNSENAYQAISTYINHYELIHNTFFIQVRKTEHSTSYCCVEYADFPLDFTLVLPTYIILFQLMKLYTTTPNIAICFADINIGHRIKSQIDALFGIQCQWGQKNYHIRLSNAQLYTQHIHFNPALNACQRQHLAQHYNSIFRYQGKLSRQVIHNIKKYIKSNACTDNISILNFVCQQLNISRWTLNRRLHHEGLNFNELMKQVKLRESQHLLVDSRLAIQDVSEQLGFSSQSAFSRFFKTEHGITPLNFRQQHLS